MNIRADVYPRQLAAANAGVWADQPASTLLFAALAAIVIAYGLLIDRTFLVDQQNYIDDFSQPWSFDWLTVGSPGGVLGTLLIAAVSEEFLWRCWTGLWGALLNPAAAVLLTVCVLNILVIASVRRLAGSFLALSLWILLPVGFAVIGLLQLRQGFAFAVMMFFALRLNRPVLGSLIAAMLHTTFAVAFVFAVIGRIFRSNPLLAVILALLVAFVGAYSGGLLFDLFGGRRLGYYSVEEGASSINYIFGGLICVLPSVYWLLSEPSMGSINRVDQLVSNLAVVHVGTTVFTLFSFFLFPLGAGRIGYLTQLMLIPVLPSLLFRRRDRGALAISCLLFVYLIYLAGRTYSEGTYDVYFGL